VRYQSALRPDIIISIAKYPNNLFLFCQEMIFAFSPDA